MDLFEDGPETGGNAHDYTVSEISGAVKKVIEGEFGRVRVRGEVGRVTMPRSGHMYFDLKDDRSVISAVSWKGQVARMQVRPEEGMEVIATGRLTTFPGQSRYQLVVDQVEPAGAGALMAMLEARRRQLAAEGLFDAARKRALPWLPEVIGVVTSPSGAVIRDILHRLRDRFPRRVLIWPVAVQGQACAPEVSRAIAGFNALPLGGAIPRPDLLIVARGGGSIEDLWGFNEESVVRAAAQSQIPLISAVGHETDTTLIDHAADRRAPTPTAAAEIAVPVRAELALRLRDDALRLDRGIRGRLDMLRQRHGDLSRALGRPETLLAPARQRFDLWSDRLGPALRAVTLRKREGFGRLDARLSPALLGRQIGQERRRLEGLSQRLDASLLRNRDMAARRIGEARQRLEELQARMQRAQGLALARAQERLERLDRMRLTLGYEETLRRGYAVVRSGATLVTSAQVAARAETLEIQFADGRVTLGGAASGGDMGGDTGANAGAETGPASPPKASPKPTKPARKAPKPQDPPEQGSLF